MSTSQTTTGLSKPTTDQKISLGTLGYINARNRQRAYDIVIRELEASGITQATLASRLGKSPEVICRLLSRPQNWESDTFSSLIFAISGGVPKYETTYPFGKSEFVSKTTLEIKNNSMALGDSESGEFESDEETDADEVEMDAKQAA
jgi:hypothetical protein